MADRKDIHILGGGILNYCDRTTKIYIEYLKNLKCDEEWCSNGFGLLSTSMDAVIEFYRVCLYRSFEIDCEIPFKLIGLEPLVCGCVVELYDVIREVKEYDRTGINKYVFIQGCLTILTRVQGRMEDVFN